MKVVSVHANKMNVLGDDDLELVSGGVAPIIIAFGAGFLKGVEIAAAGYATYKAIEYGMEVMTHS